MSTRLRLPSPFSDSASPVQPWSTHVLPETSRETLAHVFRPAANSTSPACPPPLAAPGEMA